MSLKRGKEQQFVSNYRQNSARSTMSTHIQLNTPEHSAFAFQRLLGVDYGRKRIGIASCDAMHIAVQPQTTIDRFPQDALKENILQLKTELNAGAVVVGIPLLGDGTLDNFATECHEFGVWLGRFLGVPVVFVTERDSTERAKSLFKHHSKRGFKAQKDEIAACLILQDYIDV